MAPALKEGRVFVRAGGLADADRTVTGPVAVLIEGDRVLALGREGEVEAHPAAAGAKPLDLSRAVLIPGLVNAHAHLDLTHIGPVPFEPRGGFVGWLGQVISLRATEPDRIRQSTRMGIVRSFAGGVVAVGDIAGIGRTEPAEALRDSRLLGVSFLECFGIGIRSESAIGRAGDALDQSREALQGSARVRLGISPHAPYSAGPDLFRWAIRECESLGMPLCTHLAESAEEHELIASGSGGFEGLLARLGLWDESVAAEFGRGETPVDRVGPLLAQGRSIVVHVNDCSDRDLETLAESGASVVYCPRSSAYFLHDRAFGPHRYRDMVRAGITVALGTDSILNLPPEQSDRISTLDEMRFLFGRDATDPAALFAMATVNGARILGLEERLFRFPADAGVMAGIVAVPVDFANPADPRVAVLESKSAPMLLFPETYE